MSMPPTAATEAPRASTANSEIAEQPPLQVPVTPSFAVWWRRLTPLYLIPALALYSLFVLWPLIQIGWLALVRWDGFTPQIFIGLDNFSTLWNNQLFHTSMWHSVLWEVAALLIPPMLALGLALLFTHGRAPTLFLSSLFFPALLPPTVVASVWLLMYSPVSGPLDIGLRLLGLGGSAPDWLGDPHLALGALFVAWTWSVVGIGTLVYYAGIAAIDEAFIQLALMEGAGPLWRFLHVTLPGIRRAIAVVVLINAALAAQVFDLVFVTTGGGPGYATTILPLEEYGRAFGAEIGQGAAAACLQIGVALVPMLLVLPLLRHGDETLSSGEETRRRPLRSSLPTLAASLGLLAILFPLLWLLVVALEPGKVFTVTGPDFNPTHWQWSSFATVWNQGMGDAVGTSLLLAAGVAAGVIVLAAPAAYALTYLIPTGILSRALLLLWLIGLLQPTPVLIIPLFHLLYGFGLLNTPWGIVFPEIARSLPFAVLVLWGFMGQIPREILQAGAVDGASPLQRMLRLVLPLTRPALAIAAIWSFASSWNEYLLPTLVSQDGSLQTVPTLLASFIGKYNTQFGLLAAGSLMAMAPSLILYLLLRRPSATGLAAVERGTR